MKRRQHLSYFEWKELTINAFEMRHDNWRAIECRSMLESQGSEFIQCASVFRVVLAVTVEEIRLDILEEKVLDVAAYHIYRYEHMNRYRKDLKQNEIEEIDRDIAYIKSKVDLPVLESYDDSLMGDDEEDE